MLTRALLAWEVGNGRGHVAALAALARGLARRGIACDAVLVSDEHAAEIAPHVGAIETVPPLPYFHHLRAERGQESAASTFGEFLGDLGFFSERLVAERIEAWRGRIARTRPDVFIGDHCLLGLLAARSLGVPAVTMGNAYVCPPPELPEFPVLLEDHQARIWPEAELLAAVNGALARFGGAALARLPQIYDTELRLVYGISLLDPYRDQRREALLPPDHGGAAASATDRAACEEVFAYLSTTDASDPYLIAALMTLDLPRRVYAPAAHPHTLALLQRSGAIVETAPVAPDLIARRSRIALHAANAGMLALCVQSGLPSVVAPQQLEHLFYARRYTETGAGLMVAGPQRTDIGYHEAIRRLYDDAAARAAAAEVAVRYAPEFEGELGELAAERLVARFGGAPLTPVVHQATELPAAAVSVPPRPMVVMVDGYFPDRRLGYGFPRGRAIVEFLVRRGHAVVFIETEGRNSDAGLTGALRERVRIVSVAGPDGVARLQGLLGGLDPQDAILWVSRRDNLERVQAALAGRPHRPPLVYDSESLRYRRHQTQHAILPKPGYDAAADEAEELFLIAQADAVCAVSEDEEAILAETLEVPVVRLGHVHHVVAPLRPWAERRAVLLLGGYAGGGALSWGDDGGAVSPNHDAARFFFREVAPRLAARSDLSILVAGWNSEPIASWPPVAGNARVEILGHADDLAALYDRALCLVAPTRFGAGLAWKVTEAFAFGVPVVTTNLIARQLGRDGAAIPLAADDADGIAAAIATLAADEALWQAKSAAGLRYVARHHGADIFAAQLAAALAAAAAAREGVVTPPDGPPFRRAPAAIR